jgi:hypothetical protein
MPSAGFETAIPAIKLSQTHALNNMTTGIASKIHKISKHREVPFWVCIVYGVHGVVKDKYRTYTLRQESWHVSAQQSNTVVG